MRPKVFWIISVRNLLRAFQPVWFCTRLAPALVFLTPLPRISHRWSPSPWVVIGILMPIYYNSSIIGGSGCCHSADSMSAARQGATCGNAGWLVWKRKKKQPRAFGSLYKLFTLGRLIGVFVISQDVRQEQISTVFSMQRPAFLKLFVRAVCETSCNSLKWNERGSRGLWRAKPSTPPPTSTQKGSGMTSLLRPAAFTGD